MNIMPQAIAAISAAAALAAGLWEARQTAARQDELRQVDQRLASLAVRIGEAKEQRDAAVSQLAAAQWSQQQLRAFAGQSGVPERMARVPPSPTPPRAGVESSADPLAARAEEIKGLARAMPEKAIPELAFLQEEDWRELARQALEWEQPDPGGQMNWHRLTSVPISLIVRLQPGLSPDERARLLLQEARARAKTKFGRDIARALSRYARANDGRLPGEMNALHPFFDPAPPAGALSRYEIKAAGTLESQPPGTPLVAEKALVDPPFDTRLIIEPGERIRLQDITEVEKETGR